MMIGKRGFPSISPKMRAYALTEISVCDIALTIESFSFSFIYQKFAC